MSAQAKRSDLILVDFDHDKAYLKEIMQGFDESVIKKVLVMDTIGKLLNSVNNILSDLSQRIESENIEAAKQGGTQTIMTAILSGVATAAALTIPLYSKPVSETQTSSLQKAHKFIQGYAIQSTFYVNLLIYSYKATVDLDKGKHTSNAEKMQAVLSWLTPQQDICGKTMDSTSRTINEQMQSVKDIIEKYGASGIAKLYYLNKG